MLLKIRLHTIKNEKDYSYDLEKFKQWFIANSEYLNICYLKRMEKAASEAYKQIEMQKENETK